MAPILSRETVAGMDDDEIDRLPESFAIEFMNTTYLSDQLSQMGAVFRHAEVDGGIVRAIGERKDGTEVVIEMRRGANYKSPKEIARELMAQIDREKAQQVEKGRAALKVSEF